VLDAKGLIHIHEFAKLADLSWWERISRYRHPKFTGNMIQGGEYARLRNSPRVTSSVNWDWRTMRFR